MADNFQSQSGTGPSRLLSLPNEMILAILWHLDGRSLAKVQRACTELRAFVGNATALQFTIALSAAGMCDGSAGDTSVAERKKRLDDYTDAWKEFKWTKHFTFTVEPESFVYDINGGVISMLTYPGYSDKIHFYQIPSATRNVFEECWDLELDDPSGQMISYDPSQDLFLFCTENVAVINLSPYTPARYRRETFTHLP
ncbi:hypothetical protein OF83DRAFT_439927 [Amylostereum chailletii]|nr:hypothetical protein OF83DRAFT_439927 [Amylostereum chailletii]